jgi:hypothetical protein
VHLRPHGKRLAGKVWRAKWPGEVATATADVAVPFLAIAMPASWFTVLGRFPPALCAARAALFLVSH